MIETVGDLNLVNLPSKIRILAAASTTSTSSPHLTSRQNWREEVRTDCINYLKDGEAIFVDDDDDGSNEEDDEVDLDIVPQKPKESLHLIDQLMRAPLTDEEISCL